MRILIIGGNGYIGNTLAPYLRTLDFDVTTYGSRDEDYNLLGKKYLDSFDRIILLAGNSSVLSCQGPLKAPWNNNVRNFYNLAAKTATPIIYASSGSVYTNSHGKVCAEHDISMEYCSNYDLTKISLDQIAKNYITAGKQIIGLRFGTVNGASPLIRKDLMLNSMVYSAMTNGKIFVTNKHLNRPILGIKDLCQAVEQILNRTWASGIYNLASFNTSVDEISQAVSNRLGIEIVDNGNTSMPYDFLINTNKFEFIYDFKFEQTPDTIVDDLVECYKNNPVIIERNTYLDYQG